MEVPVRVLMGTSTNPIVTINREDNLGSILNQFFLEVNDMADLEVVNPAERRSAWVMAISRAPLCIDLLLFFRCLGKFSDGQPGDTR